MPIYEYDCPACERPFELLVRGGEQPACPHCGGTHLERRLSVPAAHTGGQNLPQLGPPGGGCGRPQCASKCQGMGDL